MCHFETWGAKMADSIQCLRLVGAAFLTATLVAALGLMSGCALVQPVQPWEKGVLAKPEMSFENDRLESAFAEHIYSSKEGAAGGNGVGGGGCGCN